MEARHRHGAPALDELTPLLRLDGDPADGPSGAALLRALLRVPGQEAPMPSPSIAITHAVGRVGDGRVA